MKLKLLHNAHSTTIKINSIPFQSHNFTFTHSSEERNQI